MFQFRLIAIMVTCWAMPLCADQAATRAANDDQGRQISAMIEKMGGGTMGDRMRARTISAKLQEIGKPAVPQLLEAAGNHKDPWVRIWAIGTLGSMGEWRAIDVMIANTTHPHATLRLVATGQLTRFAQRDKRIVDALTKRMADSSIDVRRWATKGLTGVISKPDVQEALKKNLASDDAEVRIDNLALLARAKGHNDPAKYVRQLAKTSTDAKERSAAYGALTRFPPAADQVGSYANLFIKATSDSSALVQREGVRGLQWILKEGDKPPSVEIQKRILDAVRTNLPTTLASDHDLLRGDALFLLSLANREKVLPDALKLAKDTSPYVREKALRALANTRQQTRAVGDAIVAAIDDPDPAVRKTAFNAMRWFMGEHSRSIFSKQGPKTEGKRIDAARTWWQANRKKHPQ